MRGVFFCCLPPLCFSALPPPSPNPLPPICVSQPRSVPIRLARRRTEKYSLFQYARSANAHLPSSDFQTKLHFSTISCIFLHRFGVSQPFCSRKESRSLPDFFRVERWMCVALSWLKIKRACPSWRPMVVITNMKKRSSEAYLATSRQNESAHFLGMENLTKIRRPKN